MLVDNVFHLFDVVTCYVQVNTVVLGVGKVA